MGMARAAGFLAVLAMLGACSAEPTVRDAGGDSYVVTGRSSNSSTGILLAQNAALRNARSFCTAQGRRFLPLKTSVSEESFAQSLAYTVRFRCPLPRSPELQQPVVKQFPDDLV